MLQNYARSSVKFPGLKLRLCKKSDKYEVCIITQNDPKHRKCLFIKCMATAAELSHESKYPGFDLKSCLGKTINKPETDPSGAACDENNLPHFLKFPTLSICLTLWSVVSLPSCLLYKSTLAYTFHL